MLCPHMLEKEQSFSPFFYKAAKCIMRASYSWPLLTLIALQRPLLQARTHWSSGVQCVCVWEKKKTINIFLGTQPRLQHSNQNQNTPVTSSIVTLTLLVLVKWNVINERFKYNTYCKWKGGSFSVSLTISYFQQPLDYTWWKCTSYRLAYFCSSCFGLFILNNYFIFSNM